MVEGGPLGHAEPVLLVHHDEGGGRQLHTVLDEGVGAAQHQRLAGGSPGSDSPFFGGGQGRDQKLGGKAQRGQEFLHSGPVLPCQQLGGGHDDRLLAVFQGEPGAGRRHQSLARAYVALQQPVHAAAAAQIGKGLLHRPALGAGGRKGQGLEKFFGIVMFQRRAGVFPTLAPKGLSGAAKDEQLFKNQPPPGLCHVAGITREMDGLKGHLRRAELPFGHHVGGQRFQITAPGLVQRRPRPLAELVLGNFPRPGIDGQQLSCRFGIVGRLEHRIDHAPAVAAELRLAEKDVLLAPLQFQIGLVEKGQLQRPRAVKDAAPGHGPSAGQAGFAGLVGHHGTDAHRRPLLQLGDGADGAPVFVVPGKIPQKVLHGEKAQLVQLGQTLRADPGQAGQGLFPVRTGGFHTRGR